MKDDAPQSKRTFVLFPYDFPINSAFLNDLKNCFMEGKMYFLPISPCSYTFPSPF